MAKSIIKSTIILVAVTMVGRLLGFFRNIFITNEFGPGIETDAYFMAFTLPFTIFLVIPGAINAVFIPAMQGLMGTENEEKRNEVFQKTMTVCLILFTLLSVAGTIWSKEIVSVLAHGFDQEQQELTAQLLQIMMPATLFIGLIAVLSSVLNAHHEFFAPSLGTVINSLLVIVSIYTLVPLWGIYGLAWGTLIGFAVFAIYLFFPVRTRHYTVRWNLSVSDDPYLKGMGERFVPILLGTVISQLYILLERFLVSGLGGLKLTSLILANSIVQLPVAIFAGALAVPLFPLLSEYVKQNQMDQMKSVMRKGLLYQYHLLLPTTMGLILLSKEIVRLFYAHSAEFTEEAVVLTAWATVFYSVGMIALAGRDMLTRVFYAVENTKTPVIIGGVSLGVYVFCGWIFIPSLDHGGIALAFSLAAFFNLAFQTIYLRKQIGALYSYEFFASIIKGALSSIVMGGVVWFLKDSLLGLGYLQVPFLMVVAVFLYFGLLMLLKEVMAKEIMGKLWVKIRPKKSG